MARLADYIVHHPYLVGATVAAAAVAIANEWRQRSRGVMAVSASEAVLLLNGGALALDVRSRDDYAAGHIIDARNIPAQEIAGGADSLKKFREKPVVLYCDSGPNAAAAARTLKALGFTKAVTLRGGLQSWRQENFPVVQGSKGKEGK